MSQGPYQITRILIPTSRSKTTLFRFIKRTGGYVASLFFLCAGCYFIVQINRSNFICPYVPLILKYRIFWLYPGLSLRCRWCIGQSGRLCPPASLSNLYPLCHVVLPPIYAENTGGMRKEATGIFYKIAVTLLLLEKRLDNKLRARHKPGPRL